MKVRLVRFLVAVLKILYWKTNREMTLEQALLKIDNLFEIDYIFSEFAVDHTVSYYSESDWAYRVYHSQSNAIHMAVSTDNTFNSRDYYYQPKLVSAQIDEVDAERVLELGCGKGFNSIFLAERYPHINFTGTDITPVHIQCAQKDKSSLKNLKFEYGNFNKLEFSDQSFDIIFAFECLCHASNFEQPLKEVYRLLKPGGKFIIFDGYKKSDISNFSEDIQNATRLTEISMAVQNGFPVLENWLMYTKEVGFEIDTIDDISLLIQPNLRRLQKMSMIFFNSYWVSLIVKNLLPYHLVQNSIAGILMPYVTQVSSGSLGYYEIVLKR